MGNTHAAAGALFATALTVPTAALVGIDLGPAEVALAAGIGTVAGLLPDIDHPDAMLTKGKVPYLEKLLGRSGRGLMRLVLLWLSIPPRIIGVPARAMGNHRGPTHSILFMLLWTALAAPLYALQLAALVWLFSIPWNLLAAALPLIGPINFHDFTQWLIHALPSVVPLVMIAVFWGYFSHLFTDSLTNVPIPWLYPLKKRGKGGKKGDYIRFFFLPKPLRVTTDSFTEKMLVRPVILVLCLYFLAVNAVVPIGQQVFNQGQQVVQQQLKDGPAKKAKPAKKHRREKR